MKMVDICLFISRYSVDIIGTQKNSFKTPTLFFYLNELYRFTYLLSITSYQGCVITSIGQSYTLFSIHTYIIIFMHRTEVTDFVFFIHYIFVFRY